MEINKLLKDNFAKWLETLGYAQSTVYVSGNYTRDFFVWLLENEIYELKQINGKVTHDYYKHLQNRKKKNQNGGLSNNYIISNINALKRFSKYLQETGKASIEIKPELKAEKSNSVTILTKVEIAALYKACNNDYLGARDKAMLSIFYGCGLRRSEGLALDVKDILLKQKRVFVRKGKNYRERYVPMSGAVKDDLDIYINTSRQKMLGFCPGTKEEAFFIGRHVKRMGGTGMIERLKKLLQEANIQKDAGFHTLRHSIATHLLQSGLALEEVKQFLGHGSLESTQIYTHVANEI